MKKYYYDNYGNWRIKPSKFQNIFNSIKPYWWNNFWYEYHHNGIYGPGGHSTKEFKTGNLALVIALFVLLLIIFEFIFRG